MQRCESGRLIWHQLVSESSDLHGTTFDDLYAAPCYATALGLGDGCREPLTRPTLKDGHASSANVERDGCEGGVAIALLSVSIRVAADRAAAAEVAGEHLQKVN